MPDTASARYYRRNREQRIADAKRRADERREILRAFKDQPCVDCGASYPHYVMDLDHIAPRGSAPRPSQMLTYSLKRLYAELEKCAVRCANCHRLRHGRDDADA